MRTDRSLVAAVTLSAVISSVFAEAPGPAADSAVPPREYVKQAIEMIRLNHINREAVDWQKITNDALAATAQAKSLSEVYPIIDQVFKQLQEPHSFLVRPKPQPGSTGTADVPVPDTRSRQLGNVGYIAISTFAGSGDRAHEYAMRIRKSIANLESHGVCGWVVDLRGNEGGNMYPAILGLGPLMGVGRLGSVLGGPAAQHWFYETDKVIVSDQDPPPPPGSSAPASDKTLPTGSREVMSFGSDAPAIHEKGAPVAVLIGRYTTSAGEGIAVSFLGSPTTRTFGEPTAGKSSANIGRRLPDGALLIITYGKFADRDGQIHWPRVVPMQPVTETELSPAFENDNTVAAAVQWIRTADKCSRL